jgi:hypothetical protein
LPCRTAHDGTSPPPVFSDNLERLQLILRHASDVEVSLDEQSWRWTATVPSLTGEDDEPVTGDHLGELIPWVQRALEKRDAAKRAAVHSQLAVLRSMWGAFFWIGWDGDWWFQRQDGKGERQHAPTSEALNKLMADEYAVCPVRKEPPQRTELRLRASRPGHPPSGGDLDDRP